MKPLNCYLWFKRFKNGACDFSDNPTPRIWPIMTEEHLKETVESRLCQDLRDLDQKLNVLCSTVSFPHSVFLQHWIQRPTIFRLCLTKNANPPFLHHIVIDNRNGILHVNRKKTTFITKFTEIVPLRLAEYDRSWTRKVQEKPSLQILFATN